MFNQTVTIFNKYKSNRQELVVKNVIEKVYMYAPFGADVSPEGMLKNAEAILLIPMKKRLGYVDNKEFDGEGWTISVDDIIIEGTTILNYDIELLNNIYNVYKIISFVTINFSGLPHIKVLMRA